MHQTIHPNKRIIINIECFYDTSTDRYVAWIEGDEYKGMVVSGDSVADCMDELSKSLKVLEIYHKNTRK